MKIVYLEKDAVISDCKQYRYLLRRVWDYKKPRLLIIMLNPSTADAEVDDATIRSVFRLCRDMGYGSFEVVNLFAWRATQPKDLPLPPSKAIGPDNARTIEAALGRCDMVVCAWGAHPYANQNKRWVIGMLELYRKRAYCFAKTKSGAPKHPLYVKSGTKLVLYT